MGTPISGGRSRHVTHSEGTGTAEETLVKGQDTKELYAFFKQLATSDGGDSLPQVNPWDSASIAPT